MNFEKLNQLKLLYVEDDEKIMESYLKTLELLFKKVVTAKNYEEAIENYKKDKPNIIFVDISLHGLSGIDIVREIRKNDFKTAIVMLTGHTDSNSLLQVANLQIDGYIVKPLTIEKLEATLTQILKRVDNYNKVNINCEYIYDFSSKELFKNGDKISLGTKENRLLELLLKNSKRTITREEIEYSVWNEIEVSDSAFKSLISSLRKKIGADKIANIIGIGWKINLD